MSKTAVESIQEVIMREIDAGIPEGLPSLDAILLPPPGWRPAPRWKSWVWRLRRGLLRLVPRITFNRGTFRGDYDE